MSVINKRMIWEPADDEMAAKYGRAEVEFLKWETRDGGDGMREAVVRLLYEDEEVVAYEDELHVRPRDLPMIEQHAVVEVATRMGWGSGMICWGRCSKNRPGKITYMVLPTEAWRGQADPGIEPFGPFVQGYVECMIWSSSTDGNEEDNSEDGGVDYNIGDWLDWDDLSVELKAQVVQDCRDFVSLCKDDGINLDEVPYDNSGSAHGVLACAGHDFWLTRNGHGAGFWDRGLGELGSKLTVLAKTYAGQDLSVGDDGLVY